MIVSEIDYYPIEFVTRDLCCERVVFVDDTERKITNLIEGTYNGVPVTREDEISGFDKLFTHNHPANSPLSVNDIRWAYLVGLREIRASTVTALYSMRPLNHKRFEGDFDRISDIMSDILKEIGEDVDHHLSTDNESRLPNYNFTPVSEARRIFQVKMLDMVADKLKLEFRVYYWN
jgi:hypothetical protein